VKTPVKIFDWYHCDLCNFRIGERVIFSDGSETTSWNGDTLTCFGLWIGKGSYEIERKISVEDIHKINLCVNKIIHASS
jgi:hypothetical protein